MISHGGKDAELTFRAVATMNSKRSKQEEVDRNFAFFKAELANVLPHHRGKYALLRDQKIVGYYDTIVDAQTSGSALYSDGLFSIQKVTDEPVDLGFYSHAVHLGAA